MNCERWCRLAARLPHDANAGQHARGRGGRGQQPDYTPLDQKPNPMCTPNPTELLPSWNRIGTASSPNTGEGPTLANPLCSSGVNPQEDWFTSNAIRIPAAKSFGSA